MSPLGQLFGPSTQAIFYNWKQLPVQRMLDFDYLCGEQQLRWNGGATLLASDMHPFVPQLHLIDKQAPTTTGRTTPSVACIVHPGSNGFQKLFFGLEEIAIPTYSRCGCEHYRAERHTHNTQHL